MPVTFRILPSHGLVYVRYDGQARLTDTTAAFAEYTRHPEFRPGQKQLVDLSGITGWDGDFLELMKIQANKAEAFSAASTQTIMVYYAPTNASLKLAKMALQSWDGLEGVVTLVQQSEMGSLALLGLAERSFSQLLQTAR